LSGFCVGGAPVLIKFTKAPRKPPRKTNMRTEVPTKREENDISTEAPKKHRNRRKTI
jgi:hypothetical protein